MNETNALLRELIDEVRELKVELVGAINEAAQTITGPLGYSLDDVVDRLGTPSIYSLSDVHEQLVEVADRLGTAASVYGIDDLFSKLSEIEVKLDET